MYDTLEPYFINKILPDAHENTIGKYLGIIMSHTHDYFVFIYFFICIYIFFVFVHYNVVEM